MWHSYITHLGRGAGVSWQSTGGLLGKGSVRVKGVKGKCVAHGLLMSRSSS